MKFSRQENFMKFSIQDGSAASSACQGCQGYRRFCEYSPILDLLGRRPSSLALC